MIDKTQQIPETLFDINPSEFPIALEDIILVSNPYDMEALQKLPNVHQFQITLEEIEMLSGIGQERHLTSTQSLIPETNLPSGAVYELAF